MHAASTVARLDTASLFPQPDALRNCPALRAGRCGCAKPSHAALRAFRLLPGSYSQLRVASSTPAAVQHRAMGAPVSKNQLKQELVRLLQNDLEALQRAHHATREGATHEEAKPENDKDTRALEQSYLARGQALRVEELAAAVAAVQAMPDHPYPDEHPVAVGALVRIAEGAQERLFFVAPEGGGASLAHGTVQVVTPRSPLGRAMLGKRAGDDCAAVVGGRDRALEIVEVR